jgi:hypothetical protein
MNVETVAENLLGLGELPMSPQLFRELEKEPALGIGLEPELQLFEFGVDAGLSHVLEVRILLNNKRRRNLGRRNEPPQRKGRFDGLTIDRSYCVVPVTVSRAVIVCVGTPLLALTVI